MKKLLAVKEFNEIKSVLKAQKQGDLVQAVNARAVHEWLGVGRVFRAWIAGRIEKCGFKEGVHYVVVENLTRPDPDASKARERITKEYFCSPDMVRHLCMLEDNEKGALIRDYFIDCETIARGNADNALLRQTSRVEFRPMTDAIKAAIDDPQPKHYIREANLINKFVLGGTAAQFKKENGFDQKEITRDMLTPMQQQAIVELQRVNTALIMMDQSYQERKQALQAYYDKKLKDKLIEEIFALES